MKIGNIITTLLIAVCFHSIATSGQRCLNTGYHKEAPSPENNFRECISWEKNSCCNITTSNSIHTNGGKELLNLDIEKCGKLSAACKRFMVDDLCFFSCEPKLIEYQVKGAEKGGWSWYDNIIENVPICSSLCDKWFEACKDDKTCVEDFLKDWYYDPDSGENYCPNGSECITYGEMYKDGKGLCDKIWGGEYYYEKSDNCMVTKFDPSGENPNIKVIKKSTPESGTMIAVITGISILAVVAILGILGLVFKN